MLSKAQLAKLMDRVAKALEGAEISGALVIFRNGTHLEALICCDNEVDKAGYSCMANALGKFLPTVRDEVNEAMKTASERTTNDPR